MQVTVGDRVYELRLIEGKLIVNGDSCASVVDHDRGEILVSTLIPMTLRMDVAAQAVSEAWAHEMQKRPMVRFVGQVT